jgi:hypothetical protein
LSISATEKLINRYIKIFEISSKVKLLEDETKRELAYDANLKTWFIVVPSGTISHIAELIAKIKLAEITNPLLIQSVFKKESDDLMQIAGWFVSLKEPIVFAWAYKIMKHYLSDTSLQKEMMEFESEYEHYLESGLDDPLIALSLHLARLSTGYDDQLDMPQESEDTWLSYVSYAKTIIKQEPSIEALLEIPSVMNQLFGVRHNRDIGMLEIFLYTDIQE